MILGLGDSELAADIPGEQQPLGTNGRVQAAERVRVMPLNVAGHALGRTPVLGLELDLLTASTGAERVPLVAIDRSNGILSRPWEPEFQ
jgi:hypothetical protein